jgi:putative ABC transport system permease protein
MLKNYLTTGLRNLWKHRGYSFINIVGLAVGIAACLLLLIVVQHELSYDTHHPDVDRLYRIVRSTTGTSGEPHYSFQTFGPLAPALEETFPEVENAIRLFRTSGYLISGEKSFRGQLCATDPDVFDVLGLDIISGDPETVFAEPFAMFVTEQTAKRHFGDEDPMGKVLTMNSRYLPGDFVIRGVIADHPPTSHLRFEALTATVPKNRFTDLLWGGWRSQSDWRQVDTYARLKPGTDPGDLEQKLSTIVEQNLGADLVDKIGYRLMPMTRVWLYAQQDFGIDWYGDISILYTIGAIAVAILLIACFNYVNLATARSQSRAVEVGLRKVVGADRGQVARQFLGESMLVALLAAAAGVLLAKLLLPTFNTMVYKTLSFDIFTPAALLGLAAIAATIGLLGGLYPALVLSSFAPTTVLKGEMHRSRRGIWLRRGLVVVQFGISVTLGLGILIMDRQMRYIQTKDLGFTSKNILNVSPVSTRPELTPKLREIHRDFSKHPGIISSSASLGTPGIPMVSNMIVITPEGRSEQRIRMLSIDENFLDTYDIPLVNGRNFSPDIASDSTSAYILSERAVTAFGWDNQTALGKRIAWPNLERQGIRDRGQVVGVVKDFHDNSLHHPMQPILLAMWESKLATFSLRYREGARDAVAEHVESTWRKYNASRPPEYYDVDEMLGWYYWQDNQLIDTCRTFGVVAVGVAILGLLGLTAFSTQQRMKEVGIRKVLGGSPGSLLTLLTREVVYLVAAANLLAGPFGYVVASWWLENFHFRTPIGVDSFLAAAGMTLLIALVTVSYQTFSALRTDPVKVLRND